MNENKSLGGGSLADFLASRVALPASDRDRVAAIDRELSRELESDQPDTDGCASLVLEAADLIANAEPIGFDWSAWDDNDGSEIEEEIDHV